MTGNLEELRAIIALKMCDGIGDISAYKLISFCGSAQEVFKEKSKHLSTIPGISASIAGLIHTGIDWKKVDKEVNFIEQNHISYVSIFDPAYPKNLLVTDSPPVLLFFTGTIEKLNHAPCVSIVGTRNATHYGTEAVAEIISSLRNTDVCVISGLAHGIDIITHKYCLQNHVPTFGVVGHGLKTIYPSTHRSYAQQMAESGGGIITEFFSDEIPNRENFPKTNRIIAGLSFATLVIEASQKSGTLITARYALDYKRQLFVLPGRYNDKNSEGCNFLIRTTAAKPILSIGSLCEELRFKKKPAAPLPKIFLELTLEEQNIMSILHQKSKSYIDHISSVSQLHVSTCSSILFNLEMKGLIRSLPGKVYELC